jgi:hypothetical protein
LAKVLKPQTFRSCGTFSHLLFVVKKADLRNEPNLLQQAVQQGFIAFSVFRLALPFVPRVLARERCGESRFGNEEKLCFAKQDRFRI